MTDARAGRRLRLLVLASTYPRWRGDPEPAFVHELARRLGDRFDVRVVCPHAPGAQSDEVLDGVEVRRFRYAPAALETLVSDGGIVGNLKRRRWKWLLVPFFMTASLLAAWRELRRWRPDVVHAHWLVPQGIVLVLLRRIGVRVPPFMVTSHGADLYALRSGIFRALKRAVLGEAARVTVVSEAMVAEATALGAAPEHVSVQPMGVDLRDRFAPGDESLRADNQVLFVGRLVEKKGVRILVDAMPAVLAERPGTELAIVGFGPEEAFLRARVAELGIGAQVRFLGAVSQSELPRLYRQASVFVAPFVVAASGDQEGLGLVMVEAAGCGCPVIASDLPAVRDVLDERVPPGDARALSAAILDMLGRSRQTRAAGAAVLRGRLASRFDWQNVAAGYAEGLSRLVE